MKIKFTTIDPDTGVEHNENTREAIESCCKLKRVGFKPHAVIFRRGQEFVIVDDTGHQSFEQFLRL